MIAFDVGEYHWQKVETPSRFYIAEIKKIDLQQGIHYFKYAFSWGEREQLKGLHKMSYFTDNFQFGLQIPKGWKQLIYSLALKLSVQFF